MASDTDRILTAVDDVRESVRCVDGKVVKLDTRMTGHLAWHDGVQEAEAKAATAGAQTTARVGVAGTWLRAMIAGLVILAAAIVFTASSVGTVNREPADEVRELRARLDKIIHKFDSVTCRDPS